MNGKPPPVPLRYKVAGPEEPAAPRTASPPPRPTKPRISHREAWFRVIIALVILLSVSVAYYGFFYHLQPLQSQSRSMVTRVSGMSARLDQAERRWTPEQIAETRARYREVYTRLFADSGALEEWLSQVHAEATPLALKVNISLGSSAPHRDFTNNLAIIPASISLEVLPLPGDTEGKTPYERLLFFGQQLAAHGKRADLAELNVNGGVDSISRAVLVFNLWAGDLGLEEGTLTATNSNAK